MAKQRNKSFSTTEELDLKIALWAEFFGYNDSELIRGAIEGFIKRAEETYPDAVLGPLLPGKTGKVYLYVLHLGDEKPIYAGKTNNPRARLSQHRAGWNTVNPDDKVSDPRQLRMNIIRETSVINAIEDENRLIRQLRKEGHELVNVVPIEVLDSERLESAG